MKNKKNAENPNLLKLITKKQKGINSILVKACEMTRQEKPLSPTQWEKLEKMMDKVFDTTKVVSWAVNMSKYVG